jgi:Fe-S-cluster-containing dehydrogenase component
MKDFKVGHFSRRSFLKIGAGAAVLGGVGLPKMAQASVEGKLSTLIDLSLCDGCTDRPVPACVASCKAIHKDTVPPVVEKIPEPWPRKTIEDWSKKKEVFDRLTPYNFIYIQKVEVDGKAVFVPRRCMHCDSPACATICPFSANHKEKNGAVVIDSDKCFGGAKCKDVCPWEIPQRQSGVGLYLHVLPDFMGNGVMFKCDLCNERLKEGASPACVEACPKKALLIGPRQAIEKIADDRVRAMGGYLYGREENGGTSTLYVSPVSFEKIHAAMEKKPGRPDMKPGVKRRMAATDPLGKAVLAAPVLGVAAAGALAWLSERKDPVKKEEERHG